jgi:hypothetical protein
MAYIPPIRRTLVKRVGFFADLHHGSVEEHSLTELIGRLDEETAESMARYLTAGTSILPTMGTRCVDVLSDDKDDIGRLEIRSDGEWAWPSDLPFFVAHYHVGLPQAFIEHARDRDWSPPQLSDEELIVAVDNLMGRKPDTSG